MKITPVDHGLQDLIGKSSGVRGGGLHISQIYGDLFSALEPDRFVLGSTPDPLRLGLGLAWETHLEKCLTNQALLNPDGETAERPGELIGPEGILYSPDIIIFNGSARLGEIKLTWASSRSVPREPSNGFPPSFDRYFVQMQAYCTCLETPHARLLAYFVNGDWDRSKAFAPQLLCWDITFTARELQENWTMLINWARKKKML
jgi:hypothetical protein